MWSSLWEVAVGWAEVAKSKCSMTVNNMTTATTMEIYFHSPCQSGIVQGVAPCIYFPFVPFTKGTQCVAHF